MWLRVKEKELTDENVSQISKYAAETGFYSAFAKQEVMLVLNRM